jgi:hypothetical protein
MLINSSINAWTVRALAVRIRELARCRIYQFSWMRRHDQRVFSIENGVAQLAFAVPRLPNRLRWVIRFQRFLLMQPVLGFSLSNSVFVAWWRQVIFWRFDKDMRYAGLSHWGYYNAHNSKFIRLLLKIS